MAGRVAVAVAVLVLVGGCADTSTSEVGLPTSDAAEQALKRECLARSGVDDRVAPSDFPYVLDDVHWARRHGYGTELAGIDRSCRAEAETTAAATRIDEVRADPRFTEAVRPWADCMRANGYPYASPAATRAALPLPDGQETRLASAEAECALSSGLATTAKALDAEYRAKSDVA